jgi:hypothetical protein
VTDRTLREMHLPAARLAELERFPPALQALLAAELASGNTLLDIGHAFPAPPVGAYALLAQPVSTRPRAPSGGLRFRERNNGTCLGEFSDADRHFLVLEAPRAPEPLPDMDAIRAAHAPPAFVPAEDATVAPMQRLRASMRMDHARWHDGTGHDLDALRELQALDAQGLEDLFTPARDGHDIEALALLDTPRARRALRAAASSASADLRLAVACHAPELIDATARERSLLQAIPCARLDATFPHLCDEIEEFHPPAVRAALLAGLLRAPGDVAYHFATLLALLAGRITSQVDLSQRPLCLQFNTDDPAARRSAFAALCALLGIDAAQALTAAERWQPTEDDGDALGEAQP